MFRGYSFRPRLWALALAAAACLAFIALGNWQTRRAEEKRTLAADLEKKRVNVAGEFLPQYTVLLDNKLRKGRPGYEVVTPLKLRDSRQHVLVNRGWIAASATRERLPEVRTPLGEVRIEGIALERLPHALELKETGRAKVRQNLDIADFGRQTGLELQPGVIEQHAGPDDGLLREWPRADARVATHESYALQWYSFAALAIALVTVLSFRKI
jgi:surfeit locus 1 family protein